MFKLGREQSCVYSNLRILRRKDNKGRNRGQRERKKRYLKNRDEATIGTKQRNERKEIFLNDPNSVNKTGNFAAEITISD